MRQVRQLLAFILVSALVAQAQGNTFTKVRYNGGSVDSKVDPKDWNNRLTITPETITLALEDGKTLNIPPKSVSNLSYGQEAHRRVGTMTVLGAVVNPVALFGLFHNTRLHFIGIQYSIGQGKTEGILLQGHKDNYRAMIVALQGVTGVPVSVGEKDREFLPVGVKGEMVKSAADEESAKQKGSESASIESTFGVVNVTSNPTGADVLINGEFVGNSPAVLKLKPGKHTVKVKMTGYGDWSREVTVQAGSEVQLTANLEKSQT